MGGKKEAAPNGTHLTFRTERTTTEDLIDIEEDALTPRRSDALTVAEQNALALTAILKEQHASLLDKLMSHQEQQTERTVMLVTEALTSVLGSSTERTVMLVREALTSALGPGSKTSADQQPPMLLSPQSGWAETEQKWLPPSPDKSGSSPNSPAPPAPMRAPAPQPESEGTPPESEVPQPESEETFERLLSQEVPKKMASKETTGSEKGKSHKDPNKYVSDASAASTPGSEKGKSHKDPNKYVSDASAASTPSKLSKNSPSKLKSSKSFLCEGEKVSSVEDNMRELSSKMWDSKKAATDNGAATTTAAGTAGSMQRRAGDLVNNPVFEKMVGVVILANSIFIAVQTNWTAENRREPDSDGWRITDLCLTTFFACELTLRMVAERSQFITGKNKTWNFFDFVVVVTAIIEECLSLTSSTKVIRILRFLRLIRLARFIRVMRFFSDLRAMIWGIMHSIASLIWAIVLLVMVMFICACYITQTVGGELIEDANGTSNMSEEEIENLATIYGNLWLTMYSLYKAITGGADWESFCDPLFEISPMAGIFFCFYVAFSLLAILNVVSAVFVANAMKSTESDSDLMIVEQTRERREKIEDVKGVFRKADSDGSGMLSYEEFQAHLSDVCVQAYFRQLDLDIEGQGMQNLWDTLDFDGDGAIDIEEFVTGCQHLKGKASRLDVARLTHGQKSQGEQLIAIAEEQHICLEKLNDFKEGISKSLNNVQMEIVALGGNGYMPRSNFSSGSGWQSPPHENENNNVQPRTVTATISATLDFPHATPPVAKRTSEPYPPVQSAPELPGQLLAENNLNYSDLHFIGQLPPPPVKEGTVQGFKCRRHTPITDQ